MAKTLKRLEEKIHGRVNILLPIFYIFIFIFYFNMEIFSPCGHFLVLGFTDFYV